MGMGMDHCEFLILDQSGVSWIVDVLFTTYGERHEAVSGCIAGSIKFWDLRYSSSVRTLCSVCQRLYA